jgi:5-oxoprolinase (ATP-hydrolysing)
MDDGSKIQLRIEINPSTGSAEFDFTGTTPEVYGNINAPTSVTHSAIIYCLRCMVADTIPLNQGCLNPITIVIPSGSLLSPSENAAVVGGNVMTSQRVVDVIFKAFHACAASQGDCNNLTFGMPPNAQGDGGWGYYETVGDHLVVYFYWILILNSSLEVDPFILWLDGCLDGFSWE